jgi:hypothetical protein
MLSKLFLCNSRFLLQKGQKQNIYIYVYILIYLITNLLIFFFLHLLYMVHDFTQFQVKSTLYKWLWNYRVRQCNNE